MTRWDWASLRTRGLAVLLAVMVVGFCLVASAHDAGAAGGCPSPDGSPRFCAQSGMADHALVVVAPVIPTAADPEPERWVPVILWDRPEFPRHVATPAPRAPPFFTR